MITHQYLLEILQYHPIDGYFQWKQARGHFSYGAVVTGKRVTIDGKEYSKGRPAWFYMYARWPGKAFKYIDGDSSNIRIDNLKDRRRKGEKKLDYWVRMTSVSNGFQVQMVDKSTNPVDLGIYETYEAAAEVRYYVQSR